MFSCFFGLYSGLVSLQATEISSCCSGGSWSVCNCVFSFIKYSFVPKKKKKSGSVLRFRHFKREKFISDKTKTELIPKIKKETKTGVLIY